MSYRSRHRKPAEYICVVDLVCLKGIDAPTIVRGYLVSSNRKHIHDTAERWRDLKIKGLRDENPTMAIGSIFRSTKLRSTTQLPDPASAEDIQAFLDSCDAQLPPAGFEIFEQEMQEFLRLNG